MGGDVGSGRGKYRCRRGEGCVHQAGWKLDRVYKLATGLRGEYDTKVPHVYWIDYIRLVKKKKN